MARKNMFEGISPAPRENNLTGTTGPAKMPEVFQAAGPVAAIRNDLRSLGSRSVQEIDPDQIEDAGFRDRLTEFDPELDALQQSIARHGQQVPVLLRPHPTLSGRYQVVYGRRRLAAIRNLGVPAKALIRSLSDEEAVLAQGQENNLRKDPSFIEKALFAGDLESAGYESRVIQDALNVNRSHTSHMRKVREAFPRPLIERIGAAPSVGWKRWYELATRILGGQIDVMSVHPAAFDEGLTSDQRFEAWVKAIPPARIVQSTSERAETVTTGISAADGSELGNVRLHKGRFSFEPHKQNAGFAVWLHEQAQDLLSRLHEDYLAATSKDR